MVDWPWKKKRTNRGPLLVNGWEITSFWPMDWVAHSTICLLMTIQASKWIFIPNFCLIANDLDTIDTFALCDLLPIVVPQHINFVQKNREKTRALFWTQQLVVSSSIPSSNRGHWVPWQDGIANAVGLLQLVEISDVFLDGLRRFRWLGAAGYGFFQPHRLWLHIFFKKKSYWTMGFGRCWILGNRI